MLPYNLDSLRKDLEHVEQELEIFKGMVSDLLKRKEQLETLIKQAEERERLKEVKENANSI